MASDSQRYKALKHMIDDGLVEVVGRNEYEGDDCESSDSIPSDLLDVVCDQNIAKKKKKKRIVTNHKICRENSI